MKHFITLLACTMLLFSSACTPKPEPSANLIQRDCKIIASAPSAQDVDFSQPNMCFSYISGLISGAANSASRIGSFMAFPYHLPADTFNPEDGSSIPPSKDVVDEHNRILNDLETVFDESFCIARYFEKETENKLEYNGDIRFLRPIYYKLAKVLTAIGDTSLIAENNGTKDTQDDYLKPHANLIFNHAYDYHSICEALNKS